MGGKRTLDEIARTSVLRSLALGPSFPRHLLRIRLLPYFQLIQGSFSTGERAPACAVPPPEGSGLARHAEGRHDSRAAETPISRSSGDCQPSRTLTWCRPPSSTSATRSGRPETSAPSTSANATPRQTPLGFSTEIEYRAVRYFTVASYLSQALGMQGSTDKNAPRSRRPSKLSTPARCSQPAEPVYQVQPPRPTCGAVE